MYEDFFGLNEKPFSIQPDPSFLYWGRGHRLAYAMLEYGVLNHAGISVVTGEVGCGKTTLVHRLLDQLSDTHTVSLLSNIQAGRGDLLSWVLMGFGQPFAGKTHVELFSQLQSFFIGEYAKGRRIVLIIDEAQNLSMDMLEELRMLSNINAGKDQLLQLILVGQPQLKDLLNRPEMLQLAQRVGSDFHLTPLNAQEVQAYLDTRLTIAGCRRRVFTDRAVELIAEQSRGVPRVINIIADTALVYAFSAEDLVVGVETIRSVVRDKVDYGVFGLAADEAAAPAISTSAKKGPVAFISSDDDDIEQKKQLEAKFRSNGDARPDSLEREPEPAMPPPLAQPTERLSDAHPMAVSSSTPLTAVKTIDEPKVRSIRGTPSNDEKEKPERQSEQSAVTGVIVIGADASVSPEAAVRSCGDGRAVVFVPIGNYEKAITAARRAGAVIAEESDAATNTRGRARNAGYRQLKKIAPHMRYVQFIDSTVALDPDWLSTAEQFMERRKEVAVVEGASGDGTIELPPFPRRSEIRVKELVGEIQTVGSAALFRAESFESVGGYRGDLQAAETKDLCIRMRRRGKHVWRLNTKMTIGLPEQKKTGKWWSARKNLGRENAYAASLHGGPPDRIGVKETARATIWGCVAPAAVLVLAAVSAIGASVMSTITPPWKVFAAVLALGAAIYLIKFLIAGIARGPLKISSWVAAFFVVLAALPEFLGVLEHMMKGGRTKPSPAGAP